MSIRFFKKICFGFGKCVLQIKAHFDKTSAKQMYNKWPKGWGPRLFFIAKLNFPDLKVKKRL